MLQMDHHSSLQRSSKNSVIHCRKSLGSSRRKQRHHKLLLITIRRQRHRVQTDDGSEIGLGNQKAQIAPHHNHRLIIPLLPLRPYLQLSLTRIAIRHRNRAHPWIMRDQSSKKEVWEAHREIMELSYNIKVIAICHNYVNFKTLKYPLNYAQLFCWLCLEFIAVTSRISYVKWLCNLHAWGCIWGMKTLGEDSSHLDDQQQQLLDT